MSLQRTVLITNKRGLHARAAAKFVKTAEMFDADVTVWRTEDGNDGDHVSARSIMGLMMLAASPGTEIDISAQGTEAQAALEALARLVLEKFHEE
jgi:phosphocarrier protein